MTTSLSRPAIVNHLVKGAVFGIAGHRLALYAQSLESPWCYLLGVVAWLLLAALLRNLHALVVMPYLVAGPDGLRVRYWKPTRSLGLAFLPFNRVVEAVIPWPEYLGCRTRKLSGGDPWDAWEGLYIDTVSASHEIGWDVFAPGVDRLMAAIGGYRENESSAPVKDGLDVPEFNRRRFVAPVRLEWKPTPSSAFDIGCGVLMAAFLLPLMFVFFGAIGSLAGMFLTVAVPFALDTVGGVGWAARIRDLKPMEDVAVPMLGGKAPLAIQVGAAGGMLFFAAMLVRFWLQDRAKARTRVLELGPEGLALGRRPDELRLVPWEDVLRADVMTLTTRTHKDGHVYESTTERLEVHVRGRSPIVLAESYGLGFAALSELIAPPPHKVLLAQRLMAAGASVEAAAAAAGLPAAG